MKWPSPLALQLEPLHLEFLASCPHRFKSTCSFLENLPHVNCEPLRTGLTNAEATLSLQIFCIVLDLHDGSGPEKLQGISLQPA